MPVDQNNPFNEMGAQQFVNQFKDAPQRMPEKDESAVPHRMLPQYLSHKKSGHK